MKHLIWVLLLIGMVGCTDPATVPDLTPPPPPTEPTLTIDYFGVTPPVLFDNGHSCWHNNPIIPYTWQGGGIQAYENLPPSVYCVCWYRIPPVTFEYTLNGEPTTATIRHCQIIIVEEDDERRTTVVAR